MPKALGDESESARLVSDLVYSLRIPFRLNDLGQIQAKTQFKIEYDG